MRRLIVPLSVLLALASLPARAQWAGTVQGAYNKATVTLNDGQFLPLQIDQNGNLKVDCITGCTGGGGTAQGTPASVSNAWPVYLSLGGAAIGSANTLPTTDSADGAAISAATMPSGGAGLLGWMSAIEKQLAGTITVTQSGTVVTTDSADGASPSSPAAANAGTGLLGWLGTIAGELSGVITTTPAGVTGAPTVASGSVSSAAGILAATATGVKRLHLKVWNFAAAGGSSLYCSDDGSTPTPTNASFIVYAQGGYERDAPGWVPSAAINCVSATGAVNYRAESYP